MIETKTLSFRTRSGTDIIDITKEVSEAIGKSKIKSGIVSVFVTGSTASISTVEYEPNLINDIKRALEKIAPERGDYEHHKTWGDDNGSAHVRATLMKPGISVPFENRKLLLGTWQNIIILDFDTKPREREIILTIIGE
ncbi:MAG: YjbQ family protein [Candidatus Aenigmarchaeota archaeon]|nr:YjbQ family protein [Candidatus Aenigmarchaeota archaeon]NIP40745.1 YjbQ family protein [Candidatus Aenigmarchaeota archaeon]NIQ18551.1 YjbQ family protein [Candidatus Aenigmarchaeota archaeon]NIS73450.1 YjbQ family protein [Candidatus Aenigmarchaeota archaeon]